MSVRPFDQQLRDAVVAGRERRYQDAVALLTDLLRRSDEYPEAVLYLGRSYHALGEHARAVTVLTFFVRLAPVSASGHFFLGRAYLALDQHRLALRHLKRSIALRPANGPALALIGVTALRLRRTAEAVEYLQRAVEADPENPRVFTAYLNALLTQAIRLFRDGDLTLSGRMFQFILRHQESSVTAHLYLGRIFRDLNKPKPALDHFDAAARLSPDDPALVLQKVTLHLSNGEPDLAVAALKEASTGLDARALATRDPAELERLLTVAFFRNGRHRDALTHGLAVLKHSPREAQIRVMVAESFRSLGDLEKARNHYQRAIEDGRGSPDIFFGLAMVLLDQADYDELQTVLTRIERQRPGDATTAYYMALCRSRKEEDAAATIRLLQQQLHVRGPDPFLMLALGKDYLRAGLPDLAEGWFRRTLRLRPEDREAALGLLEAGNRQDKPKTQREAYGVYLGLNPGADDRRKEYLKLLIAADDYEGALAQIERLIVAEPRSRTLRELLATCYRRTGRYADAIVTLKELLRADPKSEEHLKAVIYCLERTGDRDLALRVLDRALPTFPKSYTLRQIQGLLLLRAGQREKAAAAFRDVVTLNPRSWVAYESLSRIHKSLGDEVFAEKFLAKARKLKTDEQGKSAAPPRAAANTASGRVARRRSGR